MQRKDDNSEQDQQTYAVIGAAMEVHRHLKNGFLEGVYQGALEVELKLREIPFQREVALPVLYKGERLDCSYRADFVCFDDIIVELKAIERLTGIERSQVLNYLKATGLHRALLFNFGAISLQYERLVRRQDQS